jgi:hypothetical protein
VRRCSTLCYEDSPAYLLLCARRHRWLLYDLPVWVGWRKKAKSRFKMEVVIEMGVVWDT